MQMAKLKSSEIVEYAIEGRRRVKEQLNKRKPDEEYARINMSYINRDGVFFRILPENLTT